MAKYNRVHFPQMYGGNKKNVEPTLGLAEEVKTKSRDPKRKNLEKNITTLIIQSTETFHTIEMLQG